MICRVHNRPIACKDEDLGSKLVAKHYAKFFCMSSEFNFCTHMYIHTYQYMDDRPAWSLNPLLHMRTHGNNSVKGLARGRAFKL